MTHADDDASRTAARAPYRIERLTSGHDRSQFASGNESLDRPCREHVQSWQKRHLATTYVLVSSLEPTKVLGYYSLSMTNIRPGQLPSDLASKLPRSTEIGAVLLGKLAVDQNLQGLGFGRFLLFDAFERSKSLQAEIASYAMVVDAIDLRAKAFYERFGFQSFPDTPMRLFLPFKLHIARSTADR